MVVVVAVAAVAVAVLSLPAQYVGHESRIGSVDLS